MAIYSISDLHLAKSIDKPMDVFGEMWDNYMDKLYENWNSIITKDDLVIIPGDISWATYIDECYEDFKFLDMLPGKKIIVKGNHDYWWTTASKMHKYVTKEGFCTLFFLHNNSYVAGDVVICGTRGWDLPGDDFSKEDEKIYNRELKRLELSLESIDDYERQDIICAMHYPPIYSDGKKSGFVDIMYRYNVKTCVYGHLHGHAGQKAYTGKIKNIDMCFVSADYLNFKPYKVRE